MSEERKVEKIMKLTQSKKSAKIEKFLTDKDVDVVKAAVVGLGEIQDETSVNLLSKLIENDNPEIRKVAIPAFAKGQTEYAKSFIQTLMDKEKDPEVQEVISNVLRDYHVVR